jgi:hypothetical protein
MFRPGLRSEPEVAVKIESVLKGVRHIGKAEGRDTKYEVFETDQVFLLFSPSTRGGFMMNIVDKRAPQRIARSFGGKEVTSGMVARRLKSLALKVVFPVNVLYVMVAMGWAQKTARMEGNSLVFRIRRAS